MFKWFGNDENGLTAVELIAVILSLSTIYFYDKFGKLDSLYVDIVKTSIFSVAGYHGWRKFTERIKYEKEDKRGA